METICVCGEKAFHLAAILLNSDSAACVDFGLICANCGSERVRELKQIYKFGGLKDLKAALSQKEAIEVIR